MTRQTEHYDAVSGSLAALADEILDTREHLDSMQRDLNHGLAHVQTALDHFVNATRELRAWLERMGIPDALDHCTCRPAFNPYCPAHGTLEAGECDDDCPSGEAAKALEADRDELSATIERLYDGLQHLLALLPPAGAGIGCERVDEVRRTIGQLLTPDTDAAATVQRRSEMQRLYVGIDDALDVLQADAPNAFSDVRRILSNLRPVTE